MQKFGVFDICGTLYRSNTTMDFCEFQSSGFRRRYLKLSKTALGKVINKTLKVLFRYDWVRAIHISSLNGKSSYEIECLAERFALKVLSSRKIPEAFEYLDFFDKENIVLASATIEPVAKAISKYLGGVDYIATTLNYKDDICEGTIKNDLLGKKLPFFKAKHVEFFITDNTSDLDLCRISNRVVIVTKAKNLKFWEHSGLHLERVIEI